MTKRSSQLTTLCVLTLVASVLHVLAEAGAIVFLWQELLKYGWMVFAGISASFIGCFACFSGALRMFNRKRKGYVGYVFGSALHLIGLLIVWLVITPYAVDYVSVDKSLVWNSGVILVEFLATILWIYGYHRVSYDWDLSETEWTLSSEEDSSSLVQPKTESTEP